MILASPRVGTAGGTLTTQEQKETVPSEVPPYLLSPDCLCEEDSSRLCPQPYDLTDFFVKKKWWGKESQSRNGTLERTHHKKQLTGPTLFKGQSLVKHANFPSLPWQWTLPHTGSPIWTQNSSCLGIRARKESGKLGTGRQIQAEWQIPWNTKCNYRQVKLVFLSDSEQLYMVSDKGIFTYDRTFETKMDSHPEQLLLRCPHLSGYDILIKGIP